MVSGVSDRDVVLKGFAYGLVYGGQYVLGGLRVADCIPFHLRSIRLYNDLYGVFVKAFYEGVLNSSKAIYYRSGAYACKLCILGFSGRRRRFYLRKLPVMVDFFISRYRVDVETGEVTYDKPKRLTQSLVFITVDRNGMVAHLLRHHKWQIVNQLMSPSLAEIIYKTPCIK